MITLDHEDGARAGGSLTSAFRITIDDEGRVATLAVSAADAGDAPHEELLRAVFDALLSAGVAHGLDRARVAAVVMGRDGSDHPVARATLPTAGVDGELDLRFAAEAALDPLFTVEAGALLARCTSGRPGSDGTAVTGRPLAPPEVSTPTVSAGDGAEAQEVGEGITVVRALVSGRPRIQNGCVLVDDVLRLAALPPRGEPVEIFGSLEVGADLPLGARLHVTGALLVEGDLERAHIETGGDIVITGAARGTELLAGALGSAHQALRDALGGADADMAAAGALAGQLVSAASASGRRLTECDALRAVVSSRHPALAGAVAEAARALRDPDLVVEERVGDAIVQAAEEVAALVEGANVSLQRFSAAGIALAKAMMIMGAAGGSSSGVRAAQLQSCRVATRGDLVLTGPGAHNLVAEVGGDIRAESAGATVRGGTLRLGGSLITAELGSPGGAPLRVELAGPGARVAVALAHPGVEVVCGERTIVVEATTLNFEARRDDGDNVVRSGDHPG